MYGRDYLSKSLGLSPTQYSLAADAVLALVLVLSTRGLLRELMQQKWSPAANPLRSDTTPTRVPAVETVHTYPIALRVFIGMFAIAWVLGVPHSGRPDRSTSPQDYVLWLAGTIFLGVFELKSCVFSPNIMSDRFVFSGWGAQEVLFSQISDVELIGGRAGSTVMLFAQDRVIATFSALLSGFSEIKAVLLERWTVQLPY